MRSDELHEATRAIQRLRQTGLKFDLDKPDQVASALTIALSRLIKDVGAEKVRATVQEIEDEEQRRSLTQGRGRRR